MTDDTVYKQSFECIDPQTAASCRLPPIRPQGQIGLACGEFARDTVTTVSQEMHLKSNLLIFIHRSYRFNPSVLKEGNQSTLLLVHFLELVQCKL
jgi:hypothetical protein